MKCLCYSTRALKGREGENILKHFSLLKNSYQNIDYLTMNKTKKVESIIYENANIRVSHKNYFFQAYQEILRNPPKLWADVYNNLEISHLKDYNSLFIIGGLDFPSSSLNRQYKRVRVFPNDSGQILFQSIGNHIINILAVLKAHKNYNIPLHEIAFDPNELSCNIFHKDFLPNTNYQLYHGYDIPQYNIKRLDTLQYFFNSKERQLFQNIKKDNDFVIGYTILKNSNRHHYFEKIKKIKKNFKTSKIFLKYPELQINNFISHNLYLQEVKKSKYTYILPSYNEQAFSIYRFLESLYNDCIPLIDEAVVLTDVEKSFDIDLSFLVRNKPFNQNEEKNVLSLLKNKFCKFEKDYVQFNGDKNES